MRVLLWVTVMVGFWVWAVWRVDPWLALFGSVAGITGIAAALKGEK